MGAADAPATPALSSPATAHRTIDAALACSLAAFPLLPSGAQHLGFAAIWWADAWVLALASTALWLLRRRERLGLTPAEPFWIPDLAPVARGYGALLLATTGGALLGLAVEGGFAAAIDAGPAGTAGRLLEPMDLALDPLYPARVWLTMAEGALAFGAVSVWLWCTPNPVRRVQAALTGCLAGIALVGGLGVLQYVTRFNLHPYWVRMNPSVTRSHATLEDPNALGSFLVLGVGVTLGVWWGSRDRPRRRAAAALAGVLATMGIFTTVSRAAWIALPTAAFLFAAFGPELPIGSPRLAGAIRRLSRGLLIGAALVGGVWLVAKIVLPPRPPARAVTVWQVAVQTVDPRIPLEQVLKNRLVKWRAAVDEFKASPLVGVGLGRYPRLFGRTESAPRPENTHNFFLQVLAECGLFGLAALAVFLMGLAAAVRARSRESSTRPLAAGVAFGLIAFVLTWMTGHPMLTVSNGVWLASLMAVLIGAGRAARVDARAHARGSDTAAAHDLGTPSRWVAIAAVYALLLMPAVGSNIRRAEASSAAPGVYGWETAPQPPPRGIRNRRFRWTRKDASVRVAVGGPVLWLPLFLARPDLDRGPVVVRLWLDGEPLDRMELFENGWHVREYDVRRFAGREDVMLTLTVDRTFVPSDYTPTVDSRALGIGLGAPIWRTQP